MSRTRTKGDASILDPTKHVRRRYATALRLWRLGYTHLAIADLLNVKSTRAIEMARYGMLLEFLSPPTRGTIMTMKITYTGNGGDSRTVDTLTAENFFGFHNSTDKTPLAAPYSVGGGGLIDIPPEGITLSGDTPKKILVTRKAYTSDPLRPLHVVVQGRDTKVGVGESFAIMPGLFTLTIKFDDGKTGQADLIANH